MESVGMLHVSGYQTSTQDKNSTKEISKDYLCSPQLGYNSKKLVHVFCRHIFWALLLFTVCFIICFQTWNYEKLKVEAAKSFLTIQFCSTLGGFGHMCRRCQCNCCSYLPCLGLTFCRDVWMLVFGHLVVHGP